MISSKGGSKGRTFVTFGLKAALTMGVFYLLFTHPLTIDGERVTVFAALRAHAATLRWEVLAPCLLVATSIKAVGVACAMVRWHLLLVGQGIRFRFVHVAQTFLIGRFLGTFLPGTLGLDGYKLYDASRFAGRVSEPVAATVVEKLLGLCGILLTFLLSAPFGYTVLGEQPLHTLLATLPLAVVPPALMAWVLWRPQGLQRGLEALGRRIPPRLGAPLGKLARAAAAYQGKGRLVAAVYGLSFMVHATTATMYFFTAMAVGAHDLHVGEVIFASSIQIFATVISPLTIAGEGVREVVQALLLAKRIGASESILSAALGFWAAEALTLVGGYFWWRRRAEYQPEVVLSS